MSERMAGQPTSRIHGTVTYRAVLAWLGQHKCLLAVAAVLLLIDRATKVWALLYLAPHGPVKLARYFWLNYVENTGAAFGMFQNGNALLVLVMLVVMGYIVHSWEELTQYGACATWGVVLILTGALGNLYDRLTLGFVVDFLDVRVWPVFNAADSYITVGAVLLGISLAVRKAPNREEK